MRRAVSFTWALVLGCGSSTPKIEQAVLIQEQAKYEERLRRQEAESDKLKKDSEKEKGELEASRKQLQERVEQLEVQLADKQRTLDDVTSQLVDLQDAFGKLTSKERQKIEERAEKDKALKAARSELSQKFVDALKPEIDDKRVETVDTKEDQLILRFKDGALFSKGSARLQPQGRPAIERLAAAAKGAKEAFLRVEVHTDAVRAEHQGERKDTWSLTQEQGLELVRALQRLGVDPSRLAYVSYGQFRPIAPNDTEDGRSKNRRVEVVVRRDFR